MRVKPCAYTNWPRIREIHKHKYISDLHTCAVSEGCQKTSVRRYGFSSFRQTKVTLWERQISDLPTSEGSAVLRKMNAKPFVCTSWPQSNATIWDRIIWEPLTCA